MCYSVRGEHLRYANGEGGGRVPDRLLDACKDRAGHNNGGEGFPLHRQTDGTVVLRPHEHQDAVMKQRAVLVTHAVRIEEKRLEEEKLLASEQMRLDEAFNTTHQILTRSRQPSFHASKTKPKCWRCSTVLP
jgi:hypothetical protein